MRPRRSIEAGRSTGTTPGSSPGTSATPYVVYVDPKTGNVVGAQPAGGAPLDPREATAGALQLLGGLSSAATVNRFGDRVSAETLLQLAGAKPVGHGDAVVAARKEGSGSSGGSAGGGSSSFAPEVPLGVPQSPASPATIRHSLYKVRTLA